MSNLDPSVQAVAPGRDHFIPPVQDRQYPIFISISVPGWILAFDGDEDLTIMEAPNAEDTGDRDTGDRDTGVPG